MPQDLYPRFIERIDLPLRCYALLNSRGGVVDVATLGATIIALSFFLALLKIFLLRYEGLEAIEYRCNNLPSTSFSLFERKKSSLSVYLNRFSRRGWNCSKGIDLIKRGIGCHTSHKSSATRRPRISFHRLKKMYVANLASTLLHIFLAFFPSPPPLHVYIRFSRLKFCFMVYFLYT